MANNAPRNRGQTAQALRALRKNRDPGQLTSHENEAGEPVSNAGNDTAPYTWSPPFQEQFQFWVSSLQLATSAIQLEPVDVDDFRIVSVLIQYTPLADTSQLIVIPMVGGEVGDALLDQVALPPRMHPMGFVRGDVSLVAGPGAASGGPGYDQQFAARTIAPMQFRTATGDTSPISMTLDFEASSYARFAIAVAEVVVDTDNLSTVAVSWARRT